MFGAVLMFHVFRASRRERRVEGLCCVLRVVQHVPCTVVHVGRCVGCLLCFVLFCTVLSSLKSGELCWVLWCLVRHVKSS